MIHTGVRSTLWQRAARRNRELARGSVTRRLGKFGEVQPHRSESREQLSWAVGGKVPNALKVSAAQLVAVSQTFRFLEFAKPCETFPAPRCFQTDVWHLMVTATCHGPWAVLQVVVQRLSLPWSAGIRRHANKKIIARPPRDCTVWVQEQPRWCLPPGLFR